MCQLSGWDGRQKRRRTICDGRYKTVDRYRAVEDHLGGHSLLPHEITMRTDLYVCAVVKVEDTHLSTRASDVRPAIAMPI